MTTNANKHGLRAAAAERSRKHAQKTPLPPRKGTIEAAREVIASIAPEKPVAATDDRSLGKAHKFAAAAVAAKWVVLTASRGGAIEVTATRGPETIVQAWLGGVWQYEASVYAFADRTTKPRNAAGALRYLTRTVEAADAETQKVNANNAFRKREPKALAPIILPLDPELLTNEEAAKFFRGRTVKWYNRIARSPETAMVSRQSVVRVTRWEGETTVSFCCPIRGFRAFHLSAVLAIGRGRLLSTETGEIELETEDAA